MVQREQPSARIMYSGMEVFVIADEGAQPPPRSS
jgi:hypothetical protein